MSHDKEPLPARLLIDLEMLYPWMRRKVSDRFDYWEATYGPGEHVTLSQEEDGVYLCWYNDNVCYSTFVLAKYNLVGKRMSCPQSHALEEIRPHLYITREMKVAHRGLLCVLDELIVRHYTPLSVQLMEALDG